MTQGPFSCHAQQSPLSWPSVFLLPPEESSWVITSAQRQGTVPAKYGAVTLWNDRRCQSGRPAPSHPLPTPGMGDLALTTEACPPVLFFMARAHQQNPFSAGHLSSLSPKPAGLPLQMTLMRGMLNHNLSLQEPSGARGGKGPQ